VEDNLIADDVVFTGSLEGGGKGATYATGDAAIADAFGKRGNVIVRGDPGFGDLASQDFRLAPASAAWKLGIRPIPFARIGLQVDEYRRALLARVAEPLIAPALRSFLRSLDVHIVPTPLPGGPRCVLRYTLDGSEPTSRSPAYTGPIRLAASTTVRAAAYAGAGGRVRRSGTVTARFRALRLAEGIYLSDLPEQDLFAYISCWKKDCNHLGDRLSLSGRQYAKGLLLHPDVTPDGKGLGRVVYRLDGDLRRATRFRAVVGIEDAMKVYNLGSATFIVEVHREGRWERVFESPVVRLGDRPLPVDVSIAGADALQLLTTDGGDGIACDHAVWADARLQ
jgi:hypothetical protein